MSSNEREISPPKRRRVEVIELESDKEMPEVEMEVQKELEKEVEMDPQIIIDEPLMLNWESGYF